MERIYSIYCAPLGTPPRFAPGLFATPSCLFGNTPGKFSASNKFPSVFNCRVIMSQYFHQFGSWCTAPASSFPHPPSCPCAGLILYIPPGNHIFHPPVFGGLFTPWPQMLILCARERTSPLFSISLFPPKRLRATFFLSYIAHSFP